MIILRFAVCKAGFFKDRSVCTMCFGKEIKTTVGDALNCSDDPPCKGARQLPNEQHTQCGQHHSLQHYLWSS